MKSQTLDVLFIQELEDMYNSENQIIESLTKLINLASFPELKESLSKHLKETQNQVTRIEKIFSILHLPAKERLCHAMEGILKEAKKLVENKAKTATLDAAIISACQKVEHYEIASYGTLCSFAKYLEVDKDVIELLKETLDEEKSTDKILTKIAKGTLFSKGVNQEAAAANHSQIRKK